MSADTDSAEKLLAAATQSANGPMKVIFVAEARILIARERDRIRQMADLLDAIEAEIVRTTTAGSR
jgi:hypothetical protein